MRDGDYTVDRDIPVGMWPVGAVLALSLGSGLVVFVGTALLCWALQMTVRIALATAGISVLAVWILWVARIDSLFWSTEKVRPAALPAYQQTSPVVQVEVHQPEKGRWAWLDLPGGPEQLEQLARGLASGRTLSESEWSGRGRLYTRAEFRELRGELLERGLAVWRSPGAPTQGVELSAVGRQVMSRIAENVRTGAYVGNGRDVAMIDDH